jgi:hypothetical protein
MVLPVVAAGVPLELSFLQEPHTPEEKGPQRMACEIRLREARLQRQVQELRIEIDQARQARKVTEITESEHYKNLRRQAADLRKIIDG